MPTTSNLLVIKSKQFVLPSLIHYGTSQDVGIRAWEDMWFDLPSGVQSKGILAFMLDLDHGVDGAVDLAFEISLNFETVFNFSYKSSANFPPSTLHKVVSGLKPGENFLSFLMTKGGTVTAPDPDENVANGKGRIKVDEIVLHFRQKHANFVLAPAPSPA